MIEINSVNNPIIKSPRKLGQKRYHKKTQTYLIEGFRLAEEAFKNHENYLYTLGTSTALVKLTAYYELKGDRVIQITDAIAEHLSGTKNSRDILMVLLISQPRSFSFECGRWVVLDNLTDPGNIGTTIRTIDAVGFDGVILFEGSAGLYNPKARRSMQSSQFHIQIVQNPILTTISSSRENGVPAYASILDKTAKSLNNCISVLQLTLVIGNEAHEASKDVIETADKKIYVPIKGKAELLNAAVVAGIMIYHFS